MCEYKQHFMSSPGCFLSWPRLHHQVPVGFDKCAGRVRSTVPPPDICPGSDIGGPSYSAAWLHQGGPSQAPINKEISGYTLHRIHVSMTITDLATTCISVRSNVNLM